MSGHALWENSVWLTSWRAMAHASGSQLACSMRFEQHEPGMNSMEGDELESSHSWYRSWWWIPPVELQLQVL